MQPISPANPETGPLDSGGAPEHTLRVPVARPARTIDDDSRGFDYFTTDLHHLSVAIEIRRRLAERRGFLLLSGPPAPDGKLVQKHVDGAKNREGGGAMRQRATLIECKPEWTFGDVIIACSRELGLGPDAGALSIVSQVEREQRKGIMRVLILDNGDALEDDGFDDLRRFVQLDGPPNVLPVVLLVSARFAERIETRLRTLKPEIVAAMPMQHLLPGEVAAFIGYQVEPMGGRGGAAFAPETIAAIAEAAQGDPRVVNRLMRQDLDLLSRSRGPTLAIPESAAAVSDAAVAPVLAEAASQAEAPVVEPPRTPERTSANDQSRRSMARLARGLAAAAALLVVGIYAGGFLYLITPGALPDDVQKLLAPTASVSVDTPGPMVAGAVDPSATAPGAAEPAVVSGSSAAVAPPAAVARAEPAPTPPAATEATMEAAEPAAPPMPSEAAPVTAAPPAPAAPAEPGHAPPVAAAAIEPAAPPVSTEAAPVVAASPPSATPAVAQDAPAQMAAIEPAARSPAEEVAIAAPLLARADQLLAAGDMASAREFFDLAFEAGSSTAAYRLGQTYDPAFLRQAALRGVAADPAKAVAWYRRAAEAGSSEAAARLAQLLGKDANSAAAAR